MLKHEKKELSKKIRKLIEDKPILLIVKHEKLTFKEIDQVKKNINLETTQIVKIKLNILKKTLEEMEKSYSELNGILKNEVLCILSTDIFDATKASKLLTESNKQVTILEAADQKVHYNAEKITKLAQYNSIKELHSHLLNAINGVLSKFVRVVDAIAKK